MRWLLVFLLVALVVNRFGHWLGRIGLGRLPGDVRFSLLGREVFLPFASSLVLVALGALLSHLL